MERILNEIRSVKRFISARASHSACDTSQLEQSFAEQVIKLISKASLNASEVASIMEELSTDNPYGSHNAKVIETLDKHMFTAHAEGEESAAGTADNITRQMLKNWWSYFTATEWAILMDTQKALHTKLATCVHRARLLGIVNPDEQAVKWQLALIYKCHYSELPPAKLRFKHVNELKDLYISEQNSQHMQVPAPLRCYPDKAKHLPPNLFKTAYPAEPPVDRSDEMTGLASIANGIPLRKNSKLLKADQDAEADDIPSAARRPQRKPGAVKIVPDAKFCHACGRPHEPAGCGHLHAELKAEPNIKDEPAPIKMEPDLDREQIRSQLRLGGKPLMASAAPVAPSAPVLKLECPAAERDAPPEEPKLDAYALAAIEALKGRNEKRQALKRGLAADPADEDDDDADEADSPIIKRPSAKLRRPAAAEPAKCMKAAPAAEPAGKPGKPAFRPTYAVEESRSQVQCRTGLKASENNGVVAPCFKYKNFPNGKTGAINAAKKWLKEFKLKYKCE